MDSSNYHLSASSISDYNCIRSNVIESSRGVIIYVKDYLPANIRKILTDQEFLESVWFDIELDSQNKYPFVGIYRSPNSSTENTIHLFSLLDTVCNENYNHKVILGDFNFPGINWSLWTTSCYENQVEFQFLECVRDNFRSTYNSSH